MRLYRRLVLILFLFTAVIYAVFTALRLKTSDTSLPVITFPEGVPLVSVKTYREELLQDVAAWDEKDKDLADRIVLEPVSRLREDGTCSVRYLVSDRDAHVTAAARSIRFKDLTPPVFSVDRSPVFSLSQTVCVNDLVQARSCLKEDLSGSIRVTDTDYTAGRPGVYHLMMEVTDGFGGSASLRLPVIVTDADPDTPEILLRTYLVYLEQDTEAPDPGSFLLAVQSASGDISRDEVVVTGAPDMSRPGTYEMLYSVRDGSGRTGQAILTVVIEGQTDETESITDQP